MQSFIEEYQAHSNRHIENLINELKSIRTGKANSGMIENMQVTAYGGMKMKLMELSTITTEGSDALVIMPFDPSTTQDIEKSILASPLGLTPKTEGQRITIRIPPLSEEQRIKFTKLVSQMIEDTKNALRRERESVRKDIKRSFDEKLLTEDEKFRLEKEIDTLIGKQNEHLSDIKNKKDEEIMSV
jgi:ribosome recycling factor